VSFLHFSVENVKVNESTLSLLANAFFICFISIGQRLFFSFKSKTEGRKLTCNVYFFLLKAEQKEENLPANFKTLHCASPFSLI
jgi:hypothetical protein